MQREPHQAKAQGTLHVQPTCTECTCHGTTWQLLPLLLLFLLLHMVSVPDLCKSGGGSLLFDSLVPLLDSLAAQVASAHDCRGRERCLCQRAPLQCFEHGGHTGPWASRGPKR
jgi:hypothetical protein